MTKWNFTAQKTTNNNIRLNKIFAADGRTYTIGDFSNMNMLKHFVIANHICDVRAIKWLKGVC